MPWKLLEENRNIRTYSELLKNKLKIMEEAGKYKEVNWKQIGCK